MKSSKRFVGRSPSFYSHGDYRAAVHCRLEELLGGAWKARGSLLREPPQLSWRMFVPENMAGVGGPAIHTLLC